PRSPRSTLFPYTTLFRSLDNRLDPARLECGDVEALQLHGVALVQCAHFRSKLQPDLPIAKNNRGHLEPDAEFFVFDGDGGSARPDRKSTRLNSSHRTISY